MHHCNSIPIKNYKGKERFIKHFYLLCCNFTLHMITVLYMIIVSFDFIRFSIWFVLIIEISRRIIQGNKSYKNLVNCKITRRIATENKF